MKETYEKIDLEVLEINRNDVITTSSEVVPAPTPKPEHDNGFIDWGDFE